MIRWCFPPNNFGLAAGVNDGAMDAFAGARLSSVVREIIQNSLYTTNGPKSRSYAFCADTKYDENISGYVNNVELMYHEATFLEAMKNRAKKTLHSTALDAGKIAQLSNVKKLLIGHFSARYDDIKDFENEAKTVFDNTKAVSDGEIFKLNNQ